MSNFQNLDEIIYSGWWCELCRKNETSFCIEAATARMIDRHMKEQHPQWVQGARGYQGPSTWIPGSASPKGSSVTTNPTPQPSESQPVDRVMENSRPTGKQSESQPVQEELRARILDRIDFLSEHWTMKDDKRPFQFGGWREEVADELVAICQQAAEEATRKERERCLECVGEDPILMTLEDYPFDCGAYFLYTIEMANLQSRLREIRDKIKAGGGQQVVCQAHSQIQ